VIYHPCSEGSLYSLEIKLIRKLNPSLNKSGAYWRNASGVDVAARGVR
jgi:hypothetical protein